MYIKYHTILYMSNKFGLYKIIYQITFARRRRAI